jgi:hypothetical protein
MRCPSGYGYGYPAYSYAPAYSYGYAPAYSYGYAPSITLGFAAVGEPNVAACLLPGTEIAFDENVEREPSFGIGLLPNEKIGQRLAGRSTLTTP